MLNVHSKNYTVSQCDWCLTFRPNPVSPVTISIPHDGMLTQDLLGIFEKRKIGYYGRDKYVWPIAKDILLNYSANSIRGIMPRAFVDYNRSWPNPINYYPKTQKEVHTALDNVLLSYVYRTYHDTLNEFLTRSNKFFGNEKTLLIDLHGFAKQPPYAPEGGFDLILGTGNRITIPHGEIDIQFADFMSKIGYKVFLQRPVSIGPEEDYYSADFTTRYYSERYNMNALQIEIASRFRSKDSSGIGEKLSFDIAEFLSKYFSPQ